MEYLLFAAYLMLFSWLVTRVPFFRHSGLTPPELVIAYLLKVSAGILYGWIGVYYGEMAQMVDTWAYHYESLQEQQLLLSDPGAFLRGLVHSSYESGYGGFLSTENSWWNDLKGTLFVKFLAILNLFSGGHYYTNVLLFSFLTLFGPVALFRIMQAQFPGRRLSVLLATLLIPSFIYWTSGLHKDGVMATALLLLFHNLYFSFGRNRFSIGSALGALGCLLLLLALRNIFVLVLLPALAAWALARRFPPLPTFGAVYTVCLLLFFLLPKLSPGLDGPRAVAQKQHEFHQLKGGSAVPVHQLEPHLAGFVRNLPQAFSLSTLRPYPADVHHLLSLAASVEVHLLLALGLLYFIFPRRGRGASPFILCCIALALSHFLMVGYTVHFIGAIVRYRAIVLPLLLVPAVASTDWQRIRNLVFGNISIKQHT